METKLDKLEIDRATWDCGERFIKKKYEDEVYLRNPNGFRCCLGFWSEEIVGLPKSCTLNVYLPNYLLEYSTFEIGDCFHTFFEDIAEINDNPSITNQTREKQIKKIFKQCGMADVKFVGRYGK